VEDLSRSEEPKLYRELASWFHLLTAPEDYAQEAELYRRLMVETAQGEVSTVLELGCGGGNNASHLKKHFRLTLTDLSPRMLEVSRGLNPECEHIEGDMRTLRLGRTFDAVFVHDAISYITEEQGLRDTAETTFVHCRPGGVALFGPDHVREKFEPSTEHGGHDGETRSLRYLMWTWDPDSADTTYRVDFAYLLRDETDEVTVERDRHVLGLFARERWLGILRDAGFIPQVRARPQGEEGGDVFVALKPRQRGRDDADDQERGGSPGG
jgi:SAM-dependent methyltransferase